MKTLRKPNGTRPNLNSAAVAHLITIAGGGRTTPVLAQFPVQPRLICTLRNIKEAAIHLGLQHVAVDRHAAETGGYGTLAVIYGWTDKWWSWDIYETVKHQHMWSGIPGSELLL